MYDAPPATVAARIDAKPPVVRARRPHYCHSLTVVYSLDLGSHRPKLIAFESKILQGKRPEALYDVVEFCAQRGYKAVGPVMANHVCVRGD